MRLVELSVQNIRSYRDARLRFGPGITLLAGDIGTGKSSLLYAIEFALFGIARGELSGNALLRHDATEGSVTLTFEIEETTYRITRTLRRARGTVAQHTGWIETDGVREDLTANELRARVFEILGYPLQFLAKQRNLVYRSTVYTPQEEMKAILTQGSDERIETIRRLFGLDAYRTARENAQLVVRALRERENAIGAEIARVELERDTLKTRLAATQDVILQRERFEAERIAARERQQQARARCDAFAHERAQIGALRASKAMTQRQRDALLRTIEQTTALLATKHAAREQAQRAFDDAAVRLAQDASGATDIETLRARADAARAELERLRKEEGKLEHIRQECAHGPEGVVAGAPCPTCQQVVSATHLEAVHEALANKHTAVQARLVRVRAQATQATVALDAARGAIDRVTVRAQLLERIETLRLTLAAVGDDVARIERDIAQANQDLAALPPISDDAAILERERALNIEFAHASAQERKESETLLGIERSLARIDTLQETLIADRERLRSLEGSLAQRHRAAVRAAAVRAWIAQRFSPVTEAIERRVLTAVHATFAATFRSLVAQLLDDDGLRVTLDATFTPLISQYGFETDIAFLSGGERTSVALAYRLALVRAVRALLPHVATAGVVLLDEPTDGFSREQLERVTQVLRGVGAEQLVLVSHEQSLEGFVDSVVRITRGSAGSVVDAQLGPLTESL